MELRELSYKSRRCDQLKKWHLSERMQDVDDLYYGQIHVLEYIKNHPGCTQKDIADRFALSKASVTKSVKRMLKNGIIERNINESDERKFELYVSQKGLQLSEQCIQIFRETNELTYKGFSEEELKQFDSFLTRIMENLETDYSRNKNIRQLAAEETERKNRKE